MDSSVNEWYRMPDTRSKLMCATDRKKQARIRKLYSVLLLAGWLFLDKDDDDTTCEYRTD